MPDLVFSVSTKSNHNRVCNAVILFEPVPVNVSFAPMHVRVNVVKFVSCNLSVSSLMKPMFICFNTVCSLNVCNAVKFVNSTHHIRRVTLVISNHRQDFYPKTNVNYSSRTKSSPSYWTSNPRFCSLVISSRNLQHITLSAKFCIFFMILFNVTLLNQSIQSILVFDILMDLILVLLVYLRFCSI